MKEYIVVIGASAGGQDALKELLSTLPADFNAPILVVMHLSPHKSTHLATILQRSCQLKIINAANDLKIEAGHVYIAQPDLHIQIQNDKISLVHGAKINHSRPSINVLFFSAAFWYGECSIGILLSGLLDDGCAGLFAIKSADGTAIVQDLNEAEYPDMPRNAIRSVNIDHCLQAKEIGHKISELVQNPTTACRPLLKSSSLQYEIELTKTQNNVTELELHKLADPSFYACPDCQGVLWKVKDGPSRFICRVGHEYSMEFLNKLKTEEVENKLWSALRVLEEKESLQNQLISAALDISEKEKSQIHSFKESISALQQILVETKNINKYS